MMIQRTFLGESFTAESILPERRATSGGVAIDGTDVCDGTLASLRAAKEWQASA